MQSSKEQLEESKAKLKAMLDADPKLKKAFKETIEEMCKPEHVEKAANDISNSWTKLREAINNAKSK